MYATYERLLWWFCLFVLGSSLGVITVMVVTKGCDWMQDWFKMAECESILAVPDTSRPRQIPAELRAELEQPIADNET